MDEAAYEEWHKLMQPQPDSIDAEIDRFLQDPVSRVTRGTKEQKKAKSRNFPPFSDAFPSGFSLVGELALLVEAGDPHRVELLGLDREGII